MNSAEYFRLTEEIQFVQGEKGGALYNLLSGDIFPLTSEEMKIIKLLEENLSISMIESKYTELNLLVRDLTGRVALNFLGKYHKQSIYVDKASTENSFRIRENLF